MCSAQEEGSDALPFVSRKTRFPFSHLSLLISQLHPSTGASLKACAATNKTGYPTYSAGGRKRQHHFSRREYGWVGSARRFASTPCRRGGDGARCPSPIHPSLKPSMHLVKHKNLPEIMDSTCSNFQNLRLVLDMTPSMQSRGSAKPEQNGKPADDRRLRIQHADCFPEFQKGMNTMP